MTNINWDRTYGKAIGLFWNCRYVQDDKFFDVDGNEVFDPKAAPAETVIAPDLVEDVPDETIEEVIIRLLGEGLTHTAIGRELGLTQLKVTRLVGKLFK